MATKPIERLLFAQGGNCFFCEKPLPRSHASVEHLVALTFGGKDGDENCVACCKSLNSLFGRMSLKEKLKIILHQRGSFACPAGIDKEPLIENSEKYFPPQSNNTAVNKNDPDEVGNTPTTANRPQETVIPSLSPPSAIETGPQNNLAPSAKTTPAETAANKNSPTKKLPSTASAQASPAKTPAKKAPAKTPPQKKALNSHQKVSLAVEILRKHGNKKPATVKRLENTLRSQLAQAGVMTDNVSALIAELAARSYIKTTENKVDYALPAKK